MLLIAQPMLRDPNFRRSVVLICEHNEAGTFGLILNRPLTLHLAEVLDTFAGYEDPIALGGPVQPDTLHYLHRLPDDLPSAIGVFGDVYWGGDFEALQLLFTTESVDPADCRFFLGYAGWGAGQLDEELAEGSWILCPAATTDVFAAAPDQLWRTLLRRLGGEYALLSNFPDDPRMN